MDISSVLSAWSYDPEHTVRVITAADGRLLVQVRLPLGLEQYEMDGRPDGNKPFGFETFLDYLEAQKALHGVGAWTMGKDEFLKLQQEGIMMYYRYVVLYQIHDFQRVMRDTEHNMRLCDIMESSYTDDEKYAVLQFRPFIIRMYATAKAWDLCSRGLIPQALAAIDNGREAIEALDSVPTPAFAFEKARSLGTLAETRSEISQQQEGEAEEDLESELEQAIQQEDYERAARIRDQIRLKGFDPMA